MVVFGDNIWIVKTALYSHGRGEFVGALGYRIGQLQREKGPTFNVSKSGFLRSLWVSSSFLWSPCKVPPESSQLYLYLFVERSGVNGRGLIAQ